MKDIAILGPVLVQVALTFVLLLTMGKARFDAVKAGTVMRDVHSGIKPTWPERAAVVSNAFHNQFEIPMLFFAVCAFALLAGAADHIMVVLAWLFAISRLVHAGIFVTYNHIPHRFLVYLFGSLVVMAMWIRLAFLSTYGVA